MKKEKVKIEIKRLQEIAEYYQFPLAVFWGGKLPKGKTRNEILSRKAEALDKIKDILEELKE